MPRVVIRYGELKCIGVVGESVTTIPRSGGGLFGFGGGGAWRVGVGAGTGGGASVLRCVVSPRAAPSRPGRSRREPWRASNRHDEPNRRPALPARTRIATRRASPRSATSPPRCSVISAGCSGIAGSSALSKVTRSVTLSSIVTLSMFGGIESRSMTSSSTAGEDVVTATVSRIPLLIAVHGPIGVLIDQRAHEIRISGQRPDVETARGVARRDVDQ